MDRFAIFQRDDSQVLSKLGNINPVTDSAVILYFPSDCGIDGLDAPFHANIDALLEHVIAEVVGGFGVLHSAPLRLYPGRFSPAGEVYRLSGATLGESGSRLYRRPNRYHVVITLPRIDSQIM